MATSTLSPALARLIVQSHSGDVSPNELYEGPGVADYHSGHRYSGDFRAGLLDGTGTFRWFDGVTYEGQFKANRVTGRGTYRWNDGCTYSGEVVNAMRHGPGRFEFPSRGVYYEGDWVGGRPDGQGYIHYTENSFYSGGWKEGRRSGYGIMCYESGNIYDGEWFQGVRHGRGKMIWLSRGEEYDGEWRDGVPCGSGTYFWRIAAKRGHQLPMQNRYEGQWLDGKRNGRGVFQYASGARYEGEWFADMKHGKGTYVSETGRIYIGEFRKDRPIGDFERFSNTSPFKFAILDAMPITTKDDQIRQVHAVIMRHMVTLRKVYNYYTDMGLLHALHPKNVLTRVSMWQLFRQMKLHHSGATMPELDRAYAQAFKNHPLFGFRYNDPHNAREQFIFRDFLEYLLLVSHHLYGSQPGLSLHEHGIAASLSHLIKTHMLPNVMPLIDGPKRDVNPKESIRDIFQRVFLERYAMAIEKIYSETAQRSHAALPGSTKDRTHTIRSILLILKPIKFLNAGSPLSVPMIIGIYKTILPKVCDGDTCNLDYEIVFMDMYESTFKACWGLCRDEVVELDTSLEGAWISKINLESETMSAVKSELSDIAAQPPQTYLQQFLAQFHSDQQVLLQPYMAPQRDISTALSMHALVNNDVKSLVRASPFSGDGAPPVHASQPQLETVANLRRANSRVGFGASQSNMNADGVNGSTTNMVVGSGAGTNVATLPTIPSSDDDVDLVHAASGVVVGGASHLPSVTANGMQPQSQQQLQQSDSSQSRLNGRQQNTTSDFGQPSDAPVANESKIVEGSGSSGITTAEPTATADEATPRKDTDPHERFIKAVQKLAKRIDMYFQIRLRAHETLRHETELVLRDLMRERFLKAASDAAAYVRAKNDAMNGGDNNGTFSNGVGYGMAGGGVSDGADMSGPTGDDMGAGVYSDGVGDAGMTSNSNAAGGMYADNGNGQPGLNAPVAYLAGQQGALSSAVSAGSGAGN